MKNQLILFGIIFFLITTVLCGCNEQTNIISGETSIKDIHENSDKYLNKTVIVKGKYNYIPEFVIDNSSNLLFLNISDALIKSKLVSQSDYKFTGIVKYGNPINQSSTFYYIYLEVIKIEPI